MLFQTVTFEEAQLTNSIECEWWNDELIRVIQGPKTVPFFGNALLAWGVKPKDVLTEVLKYDIYGNVARVFLGPKLVVFLVDPQDVEIILSSPVHIDKSPEYRWKSWRQVLGNSSILLAMPLTTDQSCRYFAPWLGEGLLISTGDKWRTHRKIIAPTFHLNVLKSFVPLFFENSTDLVNRLKPEIGKEFDCHDYLSSITVDILLETAMGVRGAQKEKSSFDYAMAVMKWVFFSQLFNRHLTFHDSLLFQAFHHLLQLLIILPSSKTCLAIVSPSNSLWRLSRYNGTVCSVMRSGTSASTKTHCKFFDCSKSKEPWCISLHDISHVSH